MQAATKPDKRTQAIKQAWSDFSRSISRIKARISSLKKTRDEKEREAKLSTIKQAINEHQ